MEEKEDAKCSVYCNFIDKIICSIEWEIYAGRMSLPKPMKFVLKPKACPKDINSYWLAPDRFLRPQLKTTSEQKTFAKKFSSLYSLPPDEM